MRHHPARLFALPLLLAASVCFAKPPKLTVFISVDALSAELLLRHRPQLKGGLGQAMNGGAYFPYVRYEYAEVATAAGHTTLSTCANPWRHGVVSNRIWNRQTGKLEPVLWDADHPALGAPGTPDDVSPRNIGAETLADRLRLHTAMKGKVVAVSGKARASVTLAGRLGQAWWFNPEVGAFVTGTWHAKETPTWVKAFHDKKPQDAWAGKAWTLSQPARVYTGEDDRPWEADYSGLGRTFPHPLGDPGSSAANVRYYKALWASPMMGDLIVQMAKAALDGEQLGRDDVPDALFVGFSHHDLVFHVFGPNSWEAQDTLLRLDRQIGDLVTAAEKAAGKGNVLVVVSADHGGAAVPEYWQSLGLPAARMNPDELGRGLAKALKARFGADVLVGLEEINVYLNPQVMGQKKLDPAAVRSAAAQWLAAQPGVQLAVTADALGDAGALQGFGDALRKGYHPDRSGDVLFLVREYHVLTDKPAGTSHGAPYSYDALVPLVLWGKGVRPGTYRQEIRVTDIGATVAALMELTPPAQCEGTVRAEALSGR